MLRRISPHGTRDSWAGKWPLLVAAALLALAAVWLLRPAGESPAGPAGAAKDAPRPRSGYENRALWRGPASPVARAPTITGTVYDLQGDPVADAGVTAVTFQLAGNQPARAGSVKTDSLGRFELPLPVGSYYVSGDKPGYGPARVVAHSGDEVGLLLVRSGVVTGRVVDERNEPVRRFSIDVIGPMSEDFAAPAPFASRQFDSVDGSFRIEDLPDLPITLRATAAEYAPVVSAMLDVQPGDEKVVELRLGGGCTVKGVVVDRERAPLGDVFVDAELRANAGVLGVASIDAVSQADTDSEGRFALEHVPLGDVQIRAYDGAHAVTTAALRVEDCGRVGPVTLHMGSGSELSGRVLTSAGEPVQAARVTVMHQALGFVSTASDGEGRYRFTRLPGGTMRIEAARGAQRAVTVVKVPENGAAEADLPFPAEGKGEIRGRVTANGRPLAGMQLMVVTHQGKGMLDTVYPVTKVDGSYHASGLVAGLYTILVMSTSRFTSATLQVDAVVTADIDVGVKPAPVEVPEEIREKMRRMQEEHAARQKEGGVRERKGAAPGGEGAAPQEEDAAPEEEEEEVEIEEGAGAPRAR